MREVGIEFKTEQAICFDTRTINQINIKYRRRRFFYSIIKRKCEKVLGIYYYWALLIREYIILKDRRGIDKVGEIVYWADHNKVEQP